MVSCGSCIHAKALAGNIRRELGQENKEIVNALERMGFDLGEFCYCDRLGFVESVILVRECSDWTPIEAVDRDS
jgi:hypothetical protein